MSKVYQYGKDKVRYPAKGLIGIKFSELEYKTVNNEEGGGDQAITHTYLGD